MGEVIQLQGDQRNEVVGFMADKKEGLALDGKIIKVSLLCARLLQMLGSHMVSGPRLLDATNDAPDAVPIE